MTAMSDPERVPSPGDRGPTDLGGHPALRVGRPSPYTFILSFGLVSLLMDMVYEGAIAVQGPLLASVGASAAVVGAISGLGEATALGGRVFSGPWVDRTRRYWLFAIIGYAITALTVPVMGLASSVVAVGALVVIERFGKSLRAPARDTMISSAASAVGSGRGFALHELLDQVGSILGPLLVAWILVATHNQYAPALGVLAVPGAAAIVILLVLRHRVPQPTVYEAGAPAAQPATAQAGAHSTALTSRFWWYLGFTLLTCSGIATFGVLSYHIVATRLLDESTVPLLYALAMGVDAVAALATGFAYDRLHTRSLYVLPVVAMLIPLVAYRHTLAPVVAGVVLWGITTGVQESTMRAAITDIVPQASRGSAYGYFGVAMGVGALIGGSVAGFLSARSIPGLVAWTAITQTSALVILIALNKRAPAQARRIRR